MGSSCEVLGPRSFLRTQRHLRRPSVCPQIDTDAEKTEGREMGRDSKNLRASLRLGCLSEGCRHGLDRVLPDSSRLWRAGTEAVDREDHFALERAFCVKCAAWVSVPMWLANFL